MGSGIAVGMYKCSSTTFLTRSPREWQWVPAWPIAPLSPLFRQKQHTYMHTCIHAYMHTCIHAYMHTCIHHACIRACLRTYILTDLGHDQDPKDPDGKAAFKRGTAVEEVLVTFIPDPSNGPNSEPRRPRAKSAAFQRLSDAARWLALPVRFCTYVF